MAIAFYAQFAAVSMPDAGGAKRQRALVSVSRDLLRPAPGGVGVSTPCLCLGGEAALSKSAERVPSPTNTPASEMSGRGA